MAHVVPAADQLLKLWLKLAQDVVAFATPQDQSSLLEKLKDRNIERALSGVKLLSEHHPKVVAAELMAWRSKTQQEIKDGLGLTNQAGVCKRAALELVAFAGAYHLLDSYTDVSFSQPELVQFFDQQCHYAFSWVVLFEKHVPFPELATIRQMVVDRAAKLLGVMSRIRLPLIQDKFHRELDNRLTRAAGQDYGPKRTEIIRLCAGMRYITLQFDSDVQLNWAIKFLKTSAPLQYVAPVKKSQVHHALCEMLTNILTPLVRSDLPHSAAGLNARLLQDWYTNVLNLRKDLHAWVQKQNKHVQVGYPLLTLLTCLSDDDNYPVAVDTMSELLLKALKTKEHRVVALKCTQQLVFSYLKRFCWRMPTPELNKWLDKLIKPILSMFKKNALSEHQETLVQLCTLVAEMYPAYAISSILLELLQSDNPENVVTALQVLHRVLASPQQSNASANVRMNGVASSTTSLFAIRNPNAPTGLPAVTTQIKHREALDLMRRGQHPLDRPDLSQQLQQLLGVLSKVHLVCFQQYGTMLSYMGEIIPKEKLGGIAAFTWLLQLMPYVKPEQWPTSNHAPKPIDALASYTAHIEGQVRMCACGALQDLMRSSPAQRKVIISSVASFIALIPDDHTQSIGQGLQLLRTLLEDWHKIAVEHITGQFSEPGRGTDLQLDLAVTEGVLLMLLCHLDVSIRKEALNLISTVRALHQQLRLAAATSKGHARTKSLDLHNFKNKLQTSQVPGVQIVHQHSSSIDMAEFVQANGLAELPGESVVYAMDVIEEVGNDAAKRYYWDFGDQSDLLREWKHVNHDVTFQMVLAGGTEELSKLRWSRLLAATIQAMADMCPASAYVGHLEVMYKLGKLLVNNSNGRLCLPEDSRRVELWRNYAAFALSCADHAARGEKPHARVKRQGSLASQKDLVRVVLAALAGCKDKWVLQQSCILVLGNAHHDHIPFVFEELPKLQDELRNTKTKAKNKSDEGRLVVANICRVAACNLPPSMLSESQVRTRYLDLLRELYTTLRGIKTPFSEEFWENYQLAYCLCSLVQCLAPYMVKELSAAFGSVTQVLVQTPRRATQNSTTAAAVAESGVAAWKLLYELLAAWCEEGTGPGQEYLNAVTQGVNQMLNRDKDMDMDAVKRELLQKAGFLDSAARTAMAAILKGAELDSDAKRAQGPVLSWIDRLFAGRPRPISYVGPSLHAIARTALLNLLERNSDMFNTCIDRCYSGQKGVSTGFFAVLSEVYALYPVKCEQHILLSLILFKMVDPSVEVREDALHMLHVLWQREWMGHGGDSLETPSVQTSHLGTVMDELTLGGSDSVVVVGTLQDSYQKFQSQLSEKLARDHPELSEELCEEMMTRQLTSTQHPVLSCLLPWMRNLVISPHWKGNWCERLLKSMFLVTKEHGHQFPVEIQELWSTLAGSRRNIIPILEFLITFGIQTALQEQGAMQEFFGVGKRISLYLANMNPQQTIDHLVFEIMQQKNEEEPASLFATTQGLDEHMEFTSMFMPKAVPNAKELLDLAVGDRSRHGSFGQLADLLRRPNMDIAREMSRHAHTDSASSRNSTMMQQIQQNILEATSLPVLASMVTKMEEPLLPSSPTLRALMTRGEIALCLLAEIAFQHDQDFESHLPLLLHCAVVGMDSEEALVASHCQQLLLNLLYSLSAHYMGRENDDEGDPVECKQAFAVIKHIQSMKGQKMWAYEDVTLKEVHLASATQLGSMVRCVVEAMYFEPDLRPNWSTLALQWSLECKTRHVACRSLQVYRALQPQMNADCCNLLLVSLQQCFVHLSTPSLHCAVEMLLTLQVLVSLTPSNKLVLYPQLFWSTVALLQTNYVHLFACVLELMSTILRHCQLHDPWSQNVMLAACPAPLTSIIKGRGGDLDVLGATAALQSEGVWQEDDGIAWRVGYWLAGFEGQGGEEVLALQQMVLKGLLFEETEMLSIRVMSQLAHQLALCAGGGHNVHHHSHTPAASVAEAVPADKLRSRSQSFTSGMVPVPSAGVGGGYMRSESCRFAGVSGAGMVDGEVGGPDLGTQPHVAERRESGNNTSTSGAHEESKQWVQRAGVSWRGCWLHTNKRRKREAVLEALIGKRHSQLFVSIFGMLPFLCNFSTIPAVSVAALEAVQECMSALALACEACGLHTLASRVALLGHVRSASLGPLLANLAVPFTQAFFPKYARWFLRACIGLLNTPGRPLLHQHVLLLLKCVFEVEGLQLGSALQLVADSSLFDPLVALAQGPNSVAALEALGAMVSFAQNSAEAARFLNKETGPYYSPPPYLSDPLDVMGGSLTCLTAKDSSLADVLERILQAAGAHVSSHQKQRLMPYLSQYATKAMKVY